MKDNLSGSAKVIVLIILAAAAVLAVMYFTGDGAKPRIDATSDPYAHWTPENIAKDPEAYLRFCETEASKALQSLEASEIAVARNRASLETARTDAGNKIGEDEKGLDELKAAFSQAVLSKQWPLTWQGRSTDEDEAKRQIVSLHKQVEGQKGLKIRVEQGIRKLDAQIARIQEGRDQAQAQLAAIETGREMLKAQKRTAALTGKLSSIKGALQATLHTASETPEPITLEQLAEPPAGTVE